MMDGNGFRTDQKYGEIGAQKKAHRTVVVSGGKIDKNIGISGAFLQETIVGISAPDKIEVFDDGMRWIAGVLRGTRFAFEHDGIIGFAGGCIHEEHISAFDGKCPCEGDGGSRFTDAALGTGESDGSGHFATRRGSS